MVGIKAHIIQAWNVLFRDEIIDVLPPRENWLSCNGKLFLDSYIVGIKYKYAGNKEKFFYIERENEIDKNFHEYSEKEQGQMQAASQQQTLKSARECYKRIRKQIKGQSQEAQRER